MVALAVLGGSAALYPMLSDASSSRQQTPAFLEAEQQRHAAAHEERFHTHHPGSITLAQVIEIQRQRRALKPAEAAAGAVSQVPGWEAQLGAFGSAQAAQRQQARLPALSLPVAVHRDGALFRLKSAAAADPGAAQAFCAAAVAAGFDCFVRRTG
ncbi:SPOR domain-containing protein [Sphingomonas sp. S2-65]|uniref:SPOR domain-containing protein n=1 Tax=Sphingomonas sp. S2-65 TaxID=2903960 RepID=UPI001F3C618F|nr:SPOR domain-containing protein [Sphingomonas sp. S2-65]UYY59163.1 SPOR domain-containing protein [Sphingomonas sp. S2-65]